jgi:hypothetical protein
MKEMVEICLAAGIDVRNLEPLDVFQVAGKIIHDIAIHEIHVASGKGVVDTVEAIGSMTPVQRRELCERACGVIPIRRTR